MKKLLIFALTLGLLIGASAAMGATVTINNTTVAYDQYGHPWPSVNGTSHIGDPFTTQKAEFDTVTGKLKIFSDWNPGFNNTDPGIVTAFLFIDKDPLAANGWDYAVDLNAAGTATVQNKILSGLTITNSAPPSTGSWYYGKTYDGVILPSPVSATGTDTTKTAGVTWSAFGPPYVTTNYVVVDVNNMVGTGQWEFFWGTGTCANGPFDGTSDGKVPVPPSVLLLGTGILGLAGFGWRRRKTNV
jgi:hypothetical protein